MVGGMGVVQIRHTHTHAHWPCTQFYKLEGVVGVDPQITVMAAVTQKEVGQANTEGSRKKTNPWLLRTRNVYTEIKKNTSADDHDVVTDAPQEANSRLVRFGSGSFYFKVKPALLQLVDCEGGCTCDMVWLANSCSSLHKHTFVG